MLSKPTVIEVQPGVDMIGRLIGKYRIRRELGRGGMGAVYEAIHEEIGQRAAVKVLLAEVSHDVKTVRRFFDEARAVSAVEHPGLVKIFDFNQLPDGTIYILMEFLGGESLFDREKRLRDGGERLPMATAVRFTRQMASTLAAVHEQGITHRDLKPENVLIVRDPDNPIGERIKLVDFGIAKFHDPAMGERRTTQGKVLGTPDFMSPEQCAPAFMTAEQIRSAPAIGPKSDVYSLGVMAYEMIAGALPFNAGNYVGMMLAHVEKPPPPVRACREEVPEELSALLLAMMAKAPDERPTMVEVMARLDAMPDMGPPSLPPSGPPTIPGPTPSSRPTAPRPPIRAGRRRALAGAAVGLLGLAGLVLTIWLTRPRPTTMPVAVPPPVTTPEVHPAPAAVRSPAVASPPAGPSTTPISPITNDPPKKPIRAKAPEKKPEKKKERARPREQIVGRDEVVP